MTTKTHNTYPTELPESATLLHLMETESSPISDAIRALLVTDGSVTRLLECFGGAPVSIRTLTQQVINADEAIAEEMQIAPGDPVNYREVGICDKVTNTPLIHAISYCPISRLPVHAREKLMQADIPIGHILRDEKIESRREITNICTVEQPTVLHGQMRWATAPNRLFSRTYRIIHQNLPLFRIEEFIPDDLFTQSRQVTIRTPSRLHLALIDMNGSLGRVDGGVGITLDNPGFVLVAKPSDETRITAEDEILKARASSIVADLSAQYGYNSGVDIHISETIPTHSGLGSGTQLALAVASALSLLSGKEESDLAGKTGRGGTSGIGVRAFTDGGVIIDGGHRFGPGKEKNSFLPSSAAKGVKKPPLIGRFDFPEDWRIILCLPDSTPGTTYLQKVLPGASPRSGEDIPPYPDADDSGTS
jgi:beta-ribofuranosylaminobenzene 5'-phosphate synthase